jgi:hypothetical protein
MVLNLSFFSSSSESSTLISSHFNYLLSVFVHDLHVSHVFQTGESFDAKSALVGIDGT